MFEINNNNNISLSDLVLKGKTININTLSCPVKFTNDIFEFAESSEYLGFKLHNKQRFIIEEFYSKDITSERLYNVMILIGGMRGGKSAIGAIIGIFELHKLLSLDNPQEYWGILPGDEIFIVNTANSQDQSSETMFAKMMGFFKKVQWWQKYIGWLEDREKKEKHLKVGDLLAHGSTYYLFKEKSIHVKAEHSNSMSLAGKTIKVYLSDEICRADTSEDEIQGKTQKRSAQAVFNTLQKGTQTFGMEGLTVVVSAPWFEDDYGMQLLYQCGKTHLGEKKEIIQHLIDIHKKNKVSTYIGFHFTSKELNPKLSEKTLQSERNRNFKTYDRDYNAIPPKTDSPFFEDVNILTKHIINREYLVKTIDEIIEYEASTNFGLEKRSFLGKKITSVIPDKLTPRFICCDQGESDCAFVIGMGHGEKKTINIGKNLLERAVTIYDAIIIYEPSQDIRTLFVNAEFIIKELNRYFFIKKVTYDQWQSTESLQNLFISNIHTEKLGANLSMFESFFNDLYVGLVELPDDIKVIESLKSLRRVKNKIIGKKDIPDVLVRLNYLVRQAESENLVEKLWVPPQAAFIKKPVNAVAGKTFVPDNIWGSKVGEAWAPTIVKNF